MRLPALRTRRRPPAPDGDAPGRPTPPWGRLLRVPRLSELRGMLQRNPGVKLASLLMAIFLWYSITKTERDAERMVELPVSLRRIPDGLTLATPPPKPVSVTLRGPRTILDNIDERKSRLQVGLATIQLGDNRIDLNGTMLAPELPRSLKAIRFDPPSLTLRADRRTMRRLAVKPDLAGSPALGYAVAESSVTPNVVEVTGPARLVDDLKVISTEPIDLRGTNESMQRNVLLERSDPMLTFVPDVVRVTVTLEETVVARDFPKVPITPPPGAKQVVPATVDVTVRGPQRLLHNLKLEAATVKLDPAQADKPTQTAEVEIELPDGVKLVGRTPERVRVRMGGGRS